LTGSTIELLSSEFLGEDPNGKWTALFPDLDLSMRAILLSLHLDVFAIDRDPQGQPTQSDAANLYEPLDDRCVEFREPVIAMVVGESVSMRIAIPGNLQSCYSASPDGTRLLPVEHSLSNSNSDSGTIVNIDDVLSIFKKRGNSPSSSSRCNQTNADSRRPPTSAMNRYSKTTRSV
jgi:hypothetical protein